MEFKIAKCNDIVDEHKKRLDNMERINRPQSSHRQLVEFFDTRLMRIKAAVCTGRPLSLVNTRVMHGSPRTAVVGVQICSAVCFFLNFCLQPVRIF